MTRNHRGVLTHHWHVLALLLFTRGSMGFQFQSIASVAPLLGRDLALTPAQLGLLIGLYMLPGIFVAIPAALVGQWLGGKRAVLLALGLLTLGGIVLAASTSLGGVLGGAAGGYAAACLSRLLGGAGMALMNVLLTKMVADRFEGRETATAMGLLLAMWPAGIALALVSLGGLASAVSWQASAAVTAAWPLAALVLVAVLYRDLPSAAAPVAGSAQPAAPGAGSAPPASTRHLPSLRMLFLSSTAGWAWTLFNAGLITLISFSPSLLMARGASLTQAGVVSSFITWGVMIGTPTGGILTDALKRPHAIVLFACLSAATVIGLMALGSSAVHFLLMGFCIGLPTGPIMAMLGQALPESERGLGYGILLSWYYLGLGAVPAVAGWVQQATGHPLAIVALSAALILGTLVPYGVFQRVRPDAQAAR